MSTEAPIKLFPWNMSATGRWEISSLQELQTHEPEDLAEPLWKQGLLHSALIELISHGNPRKAALIARISVKTDPTREQIIIENIGPLAKDLLRCRNLKSLPSKPSEFPHHVNYVLVN